MSFIQLTITALVVCAALSSIMALAWFVQQKSRKCRLGRRIMVVRCWSGRFRRSVAAVARSSGRTGDSYRLQSSLHPGACDLGFTSLDELERPRMIRDIAT